jgi:hypothetical protein
LLIEITHLILIEEGTGYPLLGQPVKHLLLRSCLVDVHSLKLLFELIILAIGLFGTPDDRASLLSGKGPVEMIIDIDRFDKGQIKHGITAVAAMDFAANAVLFRLLHSIENLVNLRDQSLVSPEGFRKI